MTLSPTATKLLEALRNSGEAQETDANGDVWDSVYLDNVRLNGVSSHAFAGYLSALEKAGVYRQLDGEFFGWVKVASC